MKDRYKGLRNLLVVLLVVAMSVLVGVAAEGNDGEITLTKSATKKYINDNNLVYGREADVTLRAEANPYDEIQKSNFLVVFDNSSSMNSPLVSGELRNRRDEAKDAINSFIDEAMSKNTSDKTYVQFGLVEFGPENLSPNARFTNSKDTALSEINNLQNRIDEYRKNETRNNLEGTDLSSGIDGAIDVLGTDYQNKDAKTNVIIITDGVPTIYNYHPEIRSTSNFPAYCGALNKDEAMAPVGTWPHNWQVQNGCTKKPSEVAKESMDKLKSQYPNIDIYTIAYGDEEEAADILKNVNPENTTDLAKYENMTAKTGAELAERFNTILSKQQTHIGKNTVVEDTIPEYFKLTDASKKELESKGVTINETANGTTLRWEIGDLEAGQDNAKELKYRVAAVDETHGSMFTNTSATLTSTVEEDNPHYNSTNVSIDVENPVVEIPAITKDDHYKDHESYRGYKNNTINVSQEDSILNNDIHDDIRRESGHLVNDEIVVFNGEKNITDGSYTYVDGNHGKFTIYQDGSFTFEPTTGYVGDASFDYDITSHINPNYETNTVISSDSTKGITSKSTVTVHVGEKQTIDIKGTKTWDDNNNQDGKRPGSITIKLFKDDKEDRSTTVTADKDGNWNYSFEGLDKYEDGHENDDNYLINYTVDEEDVSGYTKTIDGSNIKNSYKPESTSVDVTKNWNDSSNQDGIRNNYKYEIVLTGKVDGKVINELGQTKELTPSDKDTQTITFNNLPKYNNGKEITYSVDEKITDKDGNEIDNANDGYSKEVNGTTIKNTHNPEKVSITAHKVWVDNSDSEKKRPSNIELVLYKNGKATDTEVTLNSSKDETKNSTDEWTFTFSNLDKYTNGDENTYTVKEKNTDKNYDVSYNDESNTITNTIKDLNRNVSVTKVWVDDNNRDGYRGEVNFTLTGKVGNEEVYNETITLNESKKSSEDSNKWVGEFTNVPMFKNGKLVKYELTENNFTNKDKYKSEITGNDREGYTVTNKHEIAKKNITVTKNWNDSSNQDGIRNNYKYEIVLTGKVDGKVIDELGQTKTLTPSTENTQTITFDKLPENYQGQKVTYSVDEKITDKNDKEINYSTKVYDKKVEGETITNTHTPATTNVEVTKNWNDSSNQDGIRNDYQYEIVLTGKVDGKVINELGQTKTFTPSNDNSQKITFDNLPEKYQGQTITYSVDEKITDKNNKEINDAKDGYSKEVSGNTITNTHTPAKVNVPVNKTWIDNNNSEKKRPASVQLQLYADDKETNNIATLSDENNWKYEFTELDKYSNGNEIKYTVKELNINSNYDVTYDGLTAINTIKDLSKNISVTKIWNDDNNRDGYRGEVSFTLIGTVDKEKVVNRTIKLNESNSTDDSNKWVGSFENVPIFHEGKLISYNLTESDGTHNEKYSTNVEGNDKTGFEVTNTHTIDKINITGEKIWNDQDNNDGKRPTSITVKLLADGEDTGKTTTITADNNWTYSFNDLDKNKQGEVNTPINYTVEEVVDESLKDIYTPEYTTKDNYNITITNNHEPITISYKVTKNWGDFDNNDGKRPDSITVNLYQVINGVESLYKTQEINAGNDWTYTFEGLPKYSNGQLIQYKITEDEVKGYTTGKITDVKTTEESNTIENTITNTHEKEQVNVEITKNWDDDNNEAGLRPESIQVKVYANGEYKQTVVLDAAHNWTTTLQLDKYSNGKEINYTIEEVPVDGYTSIIKGNVKDGFIITNSLSRGKTDGKDDSNNHVEITPPNTGVGNNPSLPLFILLLICSFIRVKLSNN